MIERSLVILKPDAVQRAIIGKIIARLEDAGLKIVGMKMVWIDEKFSKIQYKAHLKKSFYKGLEEFMTSGPVIAMVIEGVSAIEIVRKIIGSTEPKVALPGTIRGDFAHHSASYADKKGAAVKNLIHASGNKKEAKEEIKIWFKKSEMHSYNTVHDTHVL